MTYDFLWFRRASMERIVEQRYAVEFCFKLGKSASETFELIKQAYGDDALSHTRFFERQKCSRKSVSSSKTSDDRSNRCSRGQSEKSFGF